MAKAIQSYVIPADGLGSFVTERALRLKGKNLKGNPVYESSDGKLLFVASKRDGSTILVKVIANRCGSC